MVASSGTRADAPARPSGPASTGGPASPGAAGDLRSALKLLADPLRLRILALLEDEELSVGELSRALDLAQSRVSNHLRLLRDADLLRERRSGTSTFLRLAFAARSDAGPAAASPTIRLWNVLRQELESLPARAADRTRLASVLAGREVDERALFDRLALDWDKAAGAFETGRARERAVAQLLPRGLAVADLGCGTGYVSASLIGVCDRLVCVDRSERMLAEARRRLERRAAGTRLEFRRGELDRLPIADDELDGAVAGMVLHHLPSLEPAVAEMLRALAPGGSATVLELAPHREGWMRQALGDRHLGLEPELVLGALERAGFTDLVLEPLEDRYRPRRPDAAPGDEAASLSLYLVRGRKPGTDTEPRSR